MPNKKAQDTRMAILRAARRLFLDKGYSATSMRQIAHKARVTQSLIHHHFGSKQLLWQAVKQSMLAAYFDAQHRLLAKQETSLDVLRASIIAYFRYFQQHPELVRLLTWTILEKGQQGGHLEEKDVFQLGIDRLIQAQKQGIVRSDVQAQSILIGFMSLVQNYFLTKGVHYCGQDTPLVREEDDALDERYLADILRFFIDGVKNRAGEGGNICGT